MVYAAIGESDVAWAGMTYPEIRQVAEAAGSILVVPTGSLEQHGRHLPTATDTILADAVATLGAERASADLPVIVTPPVWTGFSPHHLPFGGTVTLTVESLLHLLEDVAETAIENGFDALLFVNGHGGNTSVLGAAVSSIGSGNPEVQVLSINYARLAAPFIDEIRESDTGGMSHGGEFETSLMLHLRPELVRE
ncbi:MAG: creatininase family protein, partial [Halobacteriales archaeon]|nr:creatininase family protein [Halobacteriales archaeon]